jgi:hypothetical protein
MYTKEGRRVKFFEMEPNGEWDDRGVGIVTVDVSSSDVPMIIVKSEVDETQTLLRVKISTAEQYQRQADSLIVWMASDDETWHGQNLALSFQDKYGCTLTLTEINEAQKSLRDAVVANNFIDSVLLPANESQLNKPQLSSGGKEVRNLGKQAAQNYHESEVDAACFACGQGGSLVRCDVCQNYYHQQCASTPGATMHKGTWYCSTCIKKLTNRNQHSPQPLQSAAPSQHQQQFQQHQPHHSSRSRVSHQKGQRVAVANQTSTGSRSNPKTSEGGKRGAPMKQGVTPTRHSVSQLVNNEREVMVASGRSGMEKGDMKNGLGPEVEGEDGDPDRGQFIRVFYNGNVIKVDSRNLDNLYKKRLYPNYPELRNANFITYYTDDDGEKINIIDEECFSIFMISDIPKDLFIIPNTH